MAAKYEHSRVFDLMKGVTEQIAGNLTSLQYLRTLDMFIWNALAPIQAECTPFFNNYFAKIVANQTRKSSTKFSSDDRMQLPVHLFNMVTETDMAKAHKHARAMFINRGLLLGFISMFLKHLERYEFLHSPFVQMNPVARTSELVAIEQSVGLRHGSSLYTVIQQVRFWDQRARSWKEKILEKYTRLALMQAQSAYKDYHHSVPLDDIIQVYLLVTSRAIDRCDPRQGVLTSFIQNWFKSGKSEVGDLAKGQNDQSLESLVEEYGDAASSIFGFTEVDTTPETIEHIAYTAKKVDKHGYVRATMGIPEFLTREQRELLALFVVED